MKSLSHVRLLATPWTAAYQAPRPWNFPGKSTGMGCHCLLCNKERQVLNDTLEEMDLIDIFRTFHPNAEEYTFFSSAHGTFSRIDHILGHKSNLSKFKKTEIISSIFSNQNTMRADVNHKKNTVRNTNTRRLHNTFLNNQQVTEEINQIHLI